MWNTAFNNEFQVLINPWAMAALYRTHKIIISTYEIKISFSWNTRILFLTPETYAPLSWTLLVFCQLKLAHTGLTTPPTTIF